MNEMKKLIDKQEQIIENLNKLCVTQEQLIETLRTKISLKDKKIELYERIMDIAHVNYKGATSE